MGKIILPQKQESDNSIDVITEVFDKVVKDERIQKAGKALGEALSERIDKLLGVKRNKK